MKQDKLLSSSCLPVSLPLFFSVFHIETRPHRFFLSSSPPHTLMPRDTGILAVVSFTCVVEDQPIPLGPRLIAQCLHALHTCGPSSTKPMHTSRRSFCSRIAMYRITLLNPKSFFAFRLTAFREKPRAVSAKRPHARWGPSLIATLNSLVLSVLYRLPSLDLVPLGRPLSIHASHRQQ